MSLVSKRTYFPQLHCLFHPHESTHFFFETHIKASYKWLKILIKMIQCLTFFSDASFYSFFFVLVNLNY